MKLTTKFFFDQTYLPTSRHRKTHSREIKEEISVNIAEPTKEEFPVAFIVHDMQSVQENMRSGKEYDSQKTVYRMFDEEIRTHNGKLYKPVRVMWGAAISTLFEDERYISGKLSRACDRHFCYDPDYFSEKSVVLSDNREIKRKIILKESKKYLYFDNKFWKECNEPRYLVLTFEFGHNHGGTGLLTEYHYNPNIPARNYFTALQREEAVEYGKKVALNRGDTKSVDGFGENDYIEVLMPEMVKLNPLKEHGEGDAFLNQLETITDHSESALEAGLLVMLASTNVTKKGKR